VSFLPHAFRFDVQHGLAGGVLGDECPGEVVVIQKRLDAGGLNPVEDGAGEGE